MKIQFICFKNFKVTNCICYQEQHNWKSRVNNPLMFYKNWKYLVSITSPFFETRAILKKKQSCLLFFHLKNNNEKETSTCMHSSVVSYFLSKINSLNHLVELQQILMYITEIARKQKVNLLIKNDTGIKNCFTNGHILFCLLLELIGRNED